nr:MAG: signal peptidase I [Leptolyngbya sp. IPPAS B-1204]
MARTRLKTVLIVSLTALVTACSPARYKTYYIPTESMLPTLEVNDRIVSDQAAYRTTAPNRGDIVIFRPPAQLTKMMQGIMTIDQDTVFVKRIVGLPGERLEVKQGKVFINNHPLSEPYLEAAPDYTWGPITIPANAFVVFGDNRNNAFDSHFWGVVPRDHLLGKVVWRYWPPERFGELPSGRPDRE